MNLQELKQQWMRHQTLLAIRFRSATGVRSTLTTLTDEDDDNYLFANKEGKPIIIRKCDILRIEEANLEPRQMGEFKKHELTGGYENDKIRRI